MRERVKGYFREVSERPGLISRDNTLVLEARGPDCCCMDRRAGPVVVTLGPDCCVGGQASGGKVKVVLLKET